MEDDRTTTGDQDGRIIHRGDRRKKQKQRDLRLRLAAASSIEPKL